MDFFFYHTGYNIKNDLKRFYSVGFGRVAAGFLNQDFQD